jgi:hypothetical protein
MSLLEKRVNALIAKAAAHAAAGHHHKALKVNVRALKLLDAAVRADPTGITRIANQPAAARLHYDQAALHHNLGAGEEAVKAARTAEHLYTDIDPTHGNPADVEAVVRQFRRAHPGDTTSFEELIGNAANSRSQLAWMLACHHGAKASDAVERLSANAVRTYEELIRVSRTYGPDDLRLVVAQTAQAHELLRR